MNGHDASAIKHPSLDEVKQYIYTNSLGFIMFQVLFVFQDYAFSINAFYTLNKLIEVFPAWCVERMPCVGTAGCLSLRV